MGSPVPMTLVAGGLRKKNGSPSGSGASDAHLCGVAVVVRARTQHLARVSEQRHQPGVRHHVWRPGRRRPARERRSHLVPACQRVQQGSAAELIDEGCAETGAPAHLRCHRQDPSTP
jgi:hypothetical protein